MKKLFATAIVSIALVIPSFGQATGAVQSQEICSRGGQVQVDGLVDKGGQVYNLKGYCARGDETTNDSAALSAAGMVAALKSGWLMFPPKSHLLTGAASPASPAPWPAAPFTDVTLGPTSQQGLVSAGTESFSRAPNGYIRALSSYNVNTTSSDVGTWLNSGKASNPSFTSSIMATMKVPATSPFQNNVGITSIVANEGSDIHGGGAVAGLFHANALANHAPIWGVNPGVTVGSGLNPTLAKAFAGEFDVNNRTGRDWSAGDAGQMTGVEIQSGGANRASYGLSIVGTSGRSTWEIGALIQNYHKNGIKFVNGEAGSVAISIHPPNNDTVDAFQVVSTTGTKVAHINNSGKISGTVLALRAGPTWTTGAGAPRGSCTTGSLFSNTSGGPGTTLYVCEAGSWRAK